MATAITIGGTAVSLPADILPLKLCPVVRGGVPTFSFAVRGGALPTLPDPYLGKEVTVAVDGSTCFVGDVTSVNTAHDGRVGWIRTYQSLGIRARGDKIPITDATSLVDSAAYNLQPEDQDYSASRAGRTIGQILSDVLTSADVANGLDAYGIGGYTGLPTTPALPTDTAADLAAMTVIPKGNVYVQGEKCLTAIEATLSEHAPNHALWVDPATKHLRILDQRSFTAHTLTMGTDPILPTPLSRDVAGCAQRVKGRGQAIAQLWIFKKSQGTLDEHFDHDALSNSAAISAWKPTDFTTGKDYQDVGTCTCPNTTTVTITSSNTALAFAANYLDQSSTGVHATLVAYDSTATGLTTMHTTRVIANTALTAGGTSSLTLEVALPALTFDHYTLMWVADGASVVWRRYKIHDTTLWDRVMRQATYDAPLVIPGGGATMTSSPIGLVLSKPNDTSTAYNVFPLTFQYLGDGVILFDAPTYVTANNQVPADVWVALPINVGELVVVSPADVGGVAQYSGTSHTDEGLEDTLVVTLPGWRDPADSSAMQDYCADLLDSVKDAVVEGGVEYLGLFAPALAMGVSLKVAATGYAAPYGWDATAIPVVEAELEWSSGGSHWVTRMRVSNRRGHYSATQFAHPARTGITWGQEGGIWAADASAALDSLSGGIAAITGDPSGAGAIAEGLLSGPTGTDLGTPTIAPGYGGGGDLGIATPGDYGLSFSGRGNNFGNDGSLRNILENGGSTIHGQTSDDVATNRARGNQQEDFA